MQSPTSSNTFDKRSRESELQLLFEQVQREIKHSMLTPSEKQKLQALLGQYRSAWNSYVNSIKPRHSRGHLRGRMDQFIEPGKEQEKKKSHNGRGGEAS